MIAKNLLKAHELERKVPKAFDWFTRLFSTVWSIGGNVVAVCSPGFRRAVSEARVDLLTSVGGLVNNHQAFQASDFNAI